MNRVKSVNNDMLGRLTSLEEQVRLNQINQLDQVETARKRKKDFRVAVHKDKTVQREFGTLMDFEHNTKDVDSIIEPVLDDLDGTLKGRVPVPSSGFVQRFGADIVDQVVGSMIQMHVKTRIRLFDQIRCLEAGARSHMGYGILKFLQPDLDHFHTSSLEEKEAFEERVKGAEKAFKQYKDQLNMPRKKRGGVAPAKPPVASGGHAPGTSQKSFATPRRVG